MVDPVGKILGKIDEFDNRVFIFENRKGQKLQPSIYGIDMFEDSDRQKAKTLRWGQKIKQDQGHGGDVFYIRRIV